MTTVFNLKANLRTKLGRSESRRIRKSGSIPAVIYNKNGENINITVGTREFEREYFKGDILSTIIHLELGSEKLQLIAQEVDTNPVTDRPDHINFIQFVNDQPVKIKVKVNFINHDKSIGLKRGGFLHIVARKIEVLCNPSDIVHAIEFDTTNLRVGDKVRAQDLTLPDGLTIYGKTEFLVASIIGRASKEDEKTEGTEAGSTPSAPAAAKAAPAKAAPAKAPAASKAPAAKAPAKK